MKEKKLFFTSSLPASSPPNLIPKLIIFLLSVSISQTLEDDESYNSCRHNNYTCGRDIRSIGYPFWGDGRPLSCGHPNFKLSCHNNGEYAAINISSHSFRVLNINASSHLMTIARLDLFRTYCPQNLTNATFDRLDSASLPYSPEVRSLYIFYGCTSKNKSQPKANTFSCPEGGESGGDGYYTVQGFIGDGQQNLIPNAAGIRCRKGIEVPALESSIDAIPDHGSTLEVALKKGFEVEYNGLYVDCSRCEGSGGVCGSNSTTSTFACHCPHATHPLTCPSPVVNQKRPLWLIIGGPVAFVLILVPLILLCYIRWRNSKTSDPLMDELSNDLATVGDFNVAQIPEFSGKKDRDLPLFSLSSIEIATHYFSNTYKIGRGGFGPVYKGKLVNGQEVAVKRLSKNSGQGLEEFKNEVVLISKLQHRNLVRLLGCCIEGEERILIYEYMPNGSLDSFIFDATKFVLLDWKFRFCIIEGIAQGLLYLHKYSRLRIIHRDLKTSNILLDDQMNPKISDFGTARVFKENESQANTKRIVGTHGYMSPEYAMDGLFSIKSDVFSFGVMMLEILSGKRNIVCFHRSDCSLNLVGYAWELWIEGRALELVDSSLVEPCSTNEVMKCVQIGLLCVQESAADRPTMSQVLSMLANEMMSLPTPKQPVFSTTITTDNVTVPANLKQCSINNVTISVLDGR